MNYNIEFVGAPGSGKTFFHKKIVSYFKKKKIIIKKPKDVFISNYLKTNTNFFFIRKLAYYFYFKKIKIKSNRIFKKEYKNLVFFINAELKKDKFLKRILNIYEKYLSSTGYSTERKFRMRINFIIDYLGAKANSEKKKINLLEEGFYQKIFLNYDQNKKKVSKYELLKYLKLVPKPQLVLFFNTDLKISRKRAKNRQEGFMYNSNKKFYLNKKNNFNDFIFDYIKGKKIKLIKINNNKFDKKKFFKLLKKIKRFI